MTEKRYFKRIWEEEYYIFDSQTISENEFDEKVEYEDYQAFADSMQGDEVVNKLNQLNDENEQLKHRLAISEKANFVTALEKENKQLKQTIHRLKQNIDELMCVNVEEDLLKENEQLKSFKSRVFNLLQDEIREESELLDYYLKEKAPYNADRQQIIIGVLKRLQKELEE